MATIDEKTSESKMVVKLYQKTEVSKYGNAISLRHEATSMMRANQYQNAIEYFTKALYVSGNCDALCYLRRGRCYLNIMKLAQAMHDVNYAEKYISQTVPWKVTSLRADIYYSMSHFEEAMIYYQRAMEQRPIDPSFKRSYFKCKDAINNSIEDPRMLKLTMKGDLSSFLKSSDYSSKPLRYLRSNRKHQSLRFSVDVEKPVANKHNEYELIHEIFRDNLLLKDLYKERYLLDYHEETKHALHETLVFLKRRTMFWQHHNPIYSRNYRKIMNLKPKLITSKDPRIVDEHMSKLCEKMYTDILKGNMDHSISRGLKYLPMIDDFDKNIDVNFDGYRSDIQGMVATCYMCLDNISSALKYFRKSLDVAKKSQIPSVIERALENMARISVNIEDYDTAIYRWLDRMHYIDNDEEMCRTMLRLSRCYMTLNNYKEAIIYAERSIKVFKFFKSSKKSIYRLRSIIIIAQALEKLTRYEDAEKFYLSSIKISEQLGFLPVTKYLQESLDEIRSMIAMRPWDITVSDTKMLTTNPLECNLGDSELEEVESKNLAATRGYRTSALGDNSRNMPANEIKQRVAKLESAKTIGDDEEHLPYITPSLVTMNKDASDSQSGISSISQSMSGIEHTRYEGVFKLQNISRVSDALFNPEEDASSLNSQNKNNTSHNIFDQECLELPSELRIIEEMRAENEVQIKRKPILFDFKNAIHEQQNFILLETKNLEKSIAPRGMNALVKEMSARAEKVLYNARYVADNERWLEKKRIEADKIALQREEDSHEREMECNYRSEEKKTDRLPPIYEVSRERYARGITFLTNEFKNIENNYKKKKYDVKKQLKKEEYVKQVKPRNCIERKINNLGLYNNKIFQVGDIAEDGDDIVKNDNVISMKKNNECSRVETKSNPNKLNNINKDTVNNRSPDKICEIYSNNGNKNEKKISNKKKNMIRSEIKNQPNATTQINTKAKIVDEQKGTEKVNTEIINNKEKDNNKNVDLLKTDKISLKADVINQDNKAIIHNPKMKQKTKNGNNLIQDIINIEKIKKNEEIEDVPHVHPTNVIKTNNTKIDKDNNTSGNMDIIKEIPQNNANNVEEDELKTDIENNKQDALIEEILSRTKLRNKSIKSNDDSSNNRNKKNRRTSLASKQSNGDRRKLSSIGMKMNNEQGKNVETGTDDNLECSVTSREQCNTPTLKPILLSKSSIDARIAKRRERAESLKLAGLTSDVLIDEGGSADDVQVQKNKRSSLTEKIIQGIFGRPSEQVSALVKQQSSRVNTSPESNTPVSNKSVKFNDGTTLEPKTTEQKTVSACNSEHSQKSYNSDQSRMSNAIRSNYIEEVKQSEKQTVLGFQTSENKTSDKSDNKNVENNDHKKISE